jgi:capsular exopolysaccharide synthesis family protein
MDHLNQPPYGSTSTALVRHPIIPPVSYDGPNSVPTSRYGLEGQDDRDSEGVLFEYWRILSRHKTSILLSAFGGLVLGFLIGIPMKPVYRARTSLEVLNLNEDFMNMKQSSPVTTNDNSFEVSEEETQAKLLNGDALLQRVFAKLDPESALRPKRPAAALSGWRSWFHLPERVELTDRQKLLAKASDTLKVRPTPRTRVLEVTADSKDPEFAAMFVNTLVSEFVQQNMEARMSVSQKTGEWLRREIDDARARLQTSEDALQSYARESGLIFTDAEETNVQTEKLQQVQQSLSNATADRIAKQARFELSKNSPPDALPDILGDEGLQEANSKLIDLRRQVASLSAVFNPGYTKLQEAQADLAAMEASFKHDREEVLKRIENDYQQAAGSEKLLSAAYDAQAREVTGQSEKAIQYNILKREVESNRTLYDTMLQQTKQASIASAMRASNVRVVDPAGAPQKPVFPNFPLNSVIGLFAGLFMSVAFVTLRERADRTLQQPGDVKLWIDLPELGTIPNSSTGKLAYGAYGRRTETSLDANSAAIPNRALGSRGESHKVELITWKNKPSIVAEAFRSALTSIFFVGENGSRPRVLVFTSASPADGKTTVVSNLAIATAEIRLKVLVIDADLRRPRMHEVFSLPNERGLTDLLSEEFSKRNLIDLIQETPIPGLHVLTGGPPTQSASHLLYSPNFAALLNEVKEEYDMILIDTPPMLQMTDARVAGRLADAVVLVARAGLTTRDSLLAVKERFAEDRIRVLGTILNDWDSRRSTNGYYSGSYYGRQYGRYAPAESEK